VVGGVADDSHPRRKEEDRLISCGIKKKSMSLQEVPWQFAILCAITQSFRRLYPGKWSCSRAPRS